MRSPILALALAAAAGTLACTSTETSTALVSPSSEKCQVQVSGAPLAFVAGGGQGTVKVSSSRDCPWSVTTNASWVSVGGTTGQGAATIPYTVAANPVPSARSAAITVVGQTVQVSQAASPCGCPLSGSGASIGFGGGRLSVDLQTLTGCAWTASSDASWLTITSGQSGSASGTVALLAAANNGAQRLGRVSVGGLTYTVTQGAAPLPAPVPPPPTPPPPTPPVPPTPPPTSTVVDGTIVRVSGRCPNVTFIIRTTTIVGASSTDYHKGACGDLRIGADVAVTGTIQTDHTVRATRIELKEHE